jgi:HTH-type transcriptional regulator, sugar sensing transcriptional regulator
LGISEHPSIVESFEKLGLSSNEARVYLALLENHPITGYQLSKNSGILRPVVYEMLNRLVEKGGARIIKSNPDTYIPVEIDEFLKNIEIDFSDAKKNINKALKEFLVVDNTDFFWNIIGKKNIINSMLMMIERAGKEIMIRVNSQDYLDDLSKKLEEKLKQGVQIDIFSHYELETKGMTLYSYKLGPAFKAEDIPKDLVLMSVDGLEGIIVYMSDEKTAKAAFSKNISLVYSVRQNILHNIYMYRIWTYLGTDRLKALINNDDRKLLERIESSLAVKK